MTFNIYTLYVKYISNKFKCPSCQCLAAGRWFSPVSSTNKTDRSYITEILLKVALNTIILTLNCLQYQWFYDIDVERMYMILFTFPPKVSERWRKMVLAIIFWFKDDYIFSIIVPRWPCILHLYLIFKWWLMLSVLVNRTKIILFIIKLFTLLHVRVGIL